jgi:hypothetical protein
MILREWNSFFKWFICTLFYEVNLCQILADPSSMKHVSCTGYTDPAVTVYETQLRHFVKVTGLPEQGQTKNRINYLEFGLHYMKYLLRSD